MLRQMQHRDYDLVFEGTQMRAYTKMVDGKEQRYIGGTASSTLKDLNGSVLGAECQVIMVNKLKALAAKMVAANSGMTAWLNHDYKIPESTLGAFTNSSLATRSEDGVDYIDLDIECRLVDPETNPRALAAWGQVKDGIRHGWSVGAYFLDFEWEDEDDWDNWDIIVKDLDLLEISLVGIPANQRAWVRSVDDLKQRAVRVAETIASEARSKPQRRELVRRALIDHDSDQQAERRALAADFRTRAERLETEPEEKEALEKAAAALEKRDADDVSPDDMRDRVGSAMSFVAKAVGHGICSKGATHLANALDVLSSVATGNAPANDNDADDTAQNNLSVAVEVLRSLSPVFVVNAVPTEDQRHALREAFDNGTSGVSIMTNDAWQADIEAKKAELATLDAVIVDKKREADEAATDKEAADATAAQATQAADEAKAAADAAQAEADRAKAESDNATQALSALGATVTEQQAALDTRTAETADLDRQIAERKSELKVLDDKIAEARATRLGRRSPTLNEELAQRNQTVDPAHYERTPSEMREILARQLSGESKSGRDAAR